jgi:hypothetical protein
MAWRLIVAAGLLHLVLIQPNHPAAMTPHALLLFPLELPVILFALIAMPAKVWWVRGLRGLLVGILLLLVISKAADYATFVAYNRAFNPLVDMGLIHAAWMLGSGSIGVPLAMGVVGVLVVLSAVLAWLLWWATGVWSALQPPPLPRLAAGAMAMPALALMIGEIGQARGAWNMPVEPRGAAFTARVALERVVTYRQTLEDLADFRRAAREDPFTRSDRRALLNAIGDHDVLLTYVESYGRSSFQNPLYFDTHVGRLRDIERRLDEQGLAMRSAYLTAPMVGGQSWLAHSTIASGLWIDNQGRYRALLASPRRTLFHYANAAGFRTAAIMPAITMSWPEADFFGFEVIHAARDLEYAGERYNWVTMPDQFTMKSMDRLERALPAGEGRAPLFAQIALISSHAPWLPVPPVIDWDVIGDGTVFNEWANDGDPPEVVWRDNDRVREKFRLAVDYSLEVVGSYAERHAADPPLMIVLGDHEPARFVSQVDGFDVPIHIIGPQHLVERIADWGWTEGMVPNEDAPVWRMDAFRDRFLVAFTHLDED